METNGLDWFSANRKPEGIGVFATNRSPLKCHPIKESIFCPTINFQALKSSEFQGEHSSALLSESQENGLLETIFEGIL